MCIFVCVWCVWCVCVCSLVKLDLSFNQLDELPTALSQLGSLQYLDLSNNSLKALLPEYGKLENLTHVNVSNNQLQSLIPEVGQWRSLKQLGTLLLLLLSHLLHCNSDLLLRLCY